MRLHGLPGCEAGAARLWVGPGRSLVGKVAILQSSSCCWLAPCRRTPRPLPPLPTSRPHSSFVHSPAACRCPPGHGDIYPSLLGSGMLDRLIAGEPAQHSTAGTFLSFYIREACLPCCTTGCPSRHACMCCLCLLPSPVLRLLCAAPAHTHHPKLLPLHRLLPPPCTWRPPPADGNTYLFVSNSDNLGATLDLDLLAHFAGTDAGFLMEVRLLLLLRFGGVCLLRNSTASRAACPGQAD